MYIHITQPTTRIKIRYATFFATLISESPMTPSARSVAKVKSVFIKRVYPAET
jgi:hypothetical protein